jgi:hypothetical protein
MQATVTIEVPLGTELAVLVFGDAAWRPLGV